MYYQGLDVLQTIQSCSRVWIRIKEISHLVGPSGKPSEHVMRNDQKTMESNVEDKLLLAIIVDSYGIIQSMI
jgi:hypothetical protein